MAPRAVRPASAAAAVLLSVAAVLVPATPAQAHPLGPPQTLRLSADGDRVQATWRAAEDDLTALGLELGVLGGSRSFVYEQGVLVPEDSDAGDAALLAESAELADYLLGALQVHQGGAVCPGRLDSAGALVEEGARLSFACPSPVDEVEVRVTTLLDVHPAYRTLASSSVGGRAVYTGDAPSHDWRLDRRADGARTAWRGLAAIGVVLGLSLPAAALLRRRRQSSG